MLTLNAEEMQRLADLLTEICQAIENHHARLQVVESVVEPILWICQNGKCGAPNTTPRVMFNAFTARYCSTCYSAQWNHPELFKKEQPHD